VLKTAFAYSVSSRYLGLVLQAITVIVLARLLTPEEIGIYTVAMMFIGAAQLFRDFGIADYLIKEETLNSDNVSAAFSLALVMGLGLAISIYLLSTVVADYYSEPGIEDVMKILSINFVLIPFGTIYMAIHRRKLNLRPAFIADICSNSLNAALAITLAYAGFAYKSMAYASVMGTLATVLIMQLHRIGEFHIRFRPSQIPRVFKFAAGVGSTNIIAYAGDNFFELYAGKQFGMEVLGIFARARSTIMLFSTLIMSSVRPLISPYIANLNREQGDIAASYVLATKYVCYLSFAFSLLMYVSADTVVLLLYGEQWMASVPYVSLIAIEFALYSTTVFCEQTLIGLGKARVFFYFRTTLTILRVSAIFLLGSYGIVAVIYGFIAISAFRVIWVAFILRREIRLRIWDMAIALAKPVLLTLVCIVSFAPYIYLHDIDNPFLGVLLLVPFAILYLAGLVVLEPHVRRYMVSKFKYFAGTR
jgi:O-antigen/teichoic acid export membrane protein